MPSINGELLKMGYLSCALAELPFAAYRESDNLVVRLDLPNIRYEPQRKIEVYAQARRGLPRLEPHPDRRLKYLDFIDVYAALDDDERIRSARDYSGEAQTMSRFGERFREGGYAAGRGVVLERLLRLKFGELPEEAHRRVEQADESTLLAWSEYVLTANRLDEVLHRGCCVVRVALGVGKLPSRGQGARRVCVPGARRNWGAAEPG